MFRKVYMSYIAIKALNQFWMVINNLKMRFFFGSSFNFDSVFKIMSNPFERNANLIKKANYKIDINTLPAKIQNIQTDMITAINQIKENLGSFKLAENGLDTAKLWTGLGDEWTDFII